MTNKFYLYINGKPIEVTEELYTYYMRSEWRNQYRDMKLKNGRIIVDNDNSKLSSRPCYRLAERNRTSGNLKRYARADSCNGQGKA